MWWRGGVVVWCAVANRFVYTLSADKTDIEYVPIGSAPTVNAIETSIQFSGWGTQHGKRARAAAFL